MRVTLKVICRELLSGLSSGEYTIADPPAGCLYTAAETVSLCALASGIGSLTEEQLLRPMYVLNGKNVQRTAPVKDGDVLMTVRPVIGG